MVENVQTLGTKVCFTWSAFSFCNCYMVASKRKSGWIYGRKRTWFVMQSLFGGYCHAREVNKTLADPRTWLVMQSLFWCDCHAREGNKTLADPWLWGAYNAHCSQSWLWIINWISTDHPGFVLFWLMISFTFTYQNGPEQICELEFCFPWVRYFFSSGLQWLESTCAL